MALDDLIRRDYEVERNIVWLQLYLFVDDLNRVNSRDYRSPGRDLVDLAPQSKFQVRVSAAFTDSRPISPDGNRAAQDQVNRLHFGQPDRAAELECAFYAGCFVNVLSQPGRIQLNEALLFPQARHRHVDNLALLECQVADSALRRVRV